MLKSILKMLSALNSNNNPGEIAHAMCCGFLLGLMPKNNLLWYLVFVFILFLRINKAFYLLLLLAGTALAPVLDVFSDKIGYAALTFQPLSGFYGTLLDIPFVAFTKFNNTVVMGSFLAGLIAYVPLYVLSRVLISLWRKYIAPKWVKSKFAKAVGKINVLSKIASKVTE